jgi:predicted phosphoribosyltransferase
VYLKGLKSPSCENKVAIIVDDGIATGLTMEVAIMELKHRNPKKIVIAVPVSPTDSAMKFRPMVDEFVALDVPKHFLGGVGAYFDHFDQVEDTEVIPMLQNYAKEHEKTVI